MNKIVLKYEGRCANCGRSISAGQTAYWDGLRHTHVDCNTPAQFDIDMPFAFRRADGESSEKTEKQTGEISQTYRRNEDRIREPEAKLAKYKSQAVPVPKPVSRNLWAITAGIAIIAFFLGGLVLGPAVAPNIAYFPAKTVEQPVTLTFTETSLITITQTPTEIPTTLAVAEKWLNPSDSNVISWADAGKYVGKTKTVEGTIVRTFRSSTNTIFLDFHDPYQGYFVAVIFASDLKSFPFKPEDFYRGKEVRVTGLIKLYEGAPEIIVKNPSQIEVAYMGTNYP